MGNCGISPKLAGEPIYLVLGASHFLFRQGENNFKALQNIGLTASSFYPFKKVGCSL